MLTQHESHARSSWTPTTDANGVPRRRLLARKARARVSRFYFEDRVEPPTPAGGPGAGVQRAPLTPGYRPALSRRTRRPRAGRRVPFSSGRGLRAGRRSGPDSRAREHVVRERPRLVHGGAVQAGQLRDVPAHVVAARVEPLRLAHRVEAPVGPGVGAGAGDPLPVARVVGDVAVDQQSRKCAAPSRQSRYRSWSGSARRSAGPGCASSPRAAAGASRRRRSGSPVRPSRQAVELVVAAVASGRRAARSPRVATSGRAASTWG